jgi:site-specific DNA-methyltransferase (adenine-specific)
MEALTSDELMRTEPQSRERRKTTTSSFGAGGRESHDASPFYARFRSPALSDADEVLNPEPVAEPFLHGDARHMDAVRDGSVALVVTSPPYFAGKQYEQELERDGIPSSYFEYLEMLRDVFAECVRKLEPGGRIAVNVANLGRKPYRSLSGDVTRILEDDLGLLLRGELIWQKAEGATGSCAWGSFRSAANPVLRDLTERVIVASKGRFDRARSIKRRAAEHLPHEVTLTTDDFLALTLDVWSIPPESARRVGHPAPFPVELPAQLIRLYTFKDDLVLDPFMGSGSALVAAAVLDRRYVGYDLDSNYVVRARQRVDDAVAARRVATAAASPFARRAREEGETAAKVAEGVLEAAGFSISDRQRRIPRTGVTVDLVARDRKSGLWFFAVGGPFTVFRAGLVRTDDVWKALGHASALRAARGDVPFVLLTAALPKQPSDGDTALRAAGPHAFFDVIDLLGDEDATRLAAYASGSGTRRPLPGFWSARDLAT